MALLEVRNLVFKAGERIVLDQASLSIAPATVHALLGTNGTGRGNH